MTGNRIPTASDLQSLTRDEWEALGHGLCAEMYDTERIEDRLGKGNGLDSFRQLEAGGNIDGWQFRRFDGRLGLEQVNKLKEAVTRAVNACKNNLGAPLRTFTVFGSLDLEPGHGKEKGEDERIAEFRVWCETEYDVSANYHGITWVHSRLLRYPHLLPHMFEDLPAALRSMEQRILNAIGGQGDLSRALKELTERSEGQLAILVQESRTHFERGLERGKAEDWRHAVQSLQDAERLASAPGVEPTLLVRVQAVLTGLLTMVGRLNEALDLGRKAVATAATLETDTPFLGVAQGNLAMALADAQLYKEARLLLLEVLRFYEDAAEPSEVVRTLNNLLLIDLSTQNWNGAATWAKRLHEESKALDRIVGVTEDSLNVLGNIATFHFRFALELPEPLQTDELKRARDSFQNLASASRGANIRRTAILADGYLAEVLALLGQWDDSDAVFESALNAAKKDGLEKIAADLLYNRALRLKEGERFEEASKVIVEALNKYRAIGDVASQNDAEDLLAKIRRKMI